MGDSNWRERNDRPSQPRGSNRGMRNRGGGGGYFRRGGGSFGPAPGTNVQYHHRDFPHPRGGIHHGNGDGQDRQDQVVKQEYDEEVKQEQEEEVSKLAAVQLQEEVAEPPAVQPEEESEANQKKAAGGARKKKPRGGNNEEQEGVEEKKEAEEEKKQLDEEKEQPARKEGSYNRGSDYNRDYQPGGYQGNRRNENHRGQQRYNPGRSDQARDKPCKFITEISGDLFSAPRDFALAHCVATDFRMGAGIAIAFKKEFARVGELLDQGKRVGEVAILEDKGRFIYYLVTKEYSWGKPTMDSLKRSLTCMKQHCVANKVKNLAMPKIGCGLDRLEWPWVLSSLEEIFQGSDVHITVYSLPENDNQMETPTPSKKSLFYVRNERMDLPNIEKGTALVYFCSEEGGVTDTMTKIDAKYRFLANHRAAKKIAGDIVLGGHKVEYIYGLVVKKRDRDPISYAHLFASLRKFRKAIEKDELGYFGIEAFRNGDDKVTMDKVITCLRGVFGGYKWKLEAWCCWPKEFESDHNWDLEKSVAGSDTVAPQ